MRKTQKIISFLLLITLLGNSNILASAQETTEINANGNIVMANESNTYTDYMSEFSIFGAKPPTGTSFVDLSNNTYNFNVEEFTVDIFTNTFFSGVTKAKVTVNRISVNKNGMQNESQGITVHLRRKDDSSVDVPYDIPLTGGSFNYINLDSSAKYYLEFTKLNDTQIYSFTGTIKNGN